MADEPMPPQESPPARERGASRRILPVACVSVAVAAIGIALLIMHDRAAEELNELQGTWFLESIEHDGQAIGPEEEFKRHGGRLTIESDTFVLVEPILKSEVYGSIRIETPKAMEMSTCRPNGKKHTMRLMYEVQADTLKYFDGKLTWRWRRGGRTID